MSDGRLLDAAHKGDVKCLQKLLDDHARVNARGANKNTPLTLAAREGFTACLFTLLDYGADVNLSTNNGDTALILAAGNNHMECVGLLIDAKARVNLPNLRGSTALHYAVENGFEKCVEYLLGFGKADTNIQNNNDETPIMIAAGKGYSGILSILLKGTAVQKANPNLINKHGDTALIKACRGGYLDCVSLLISSSCNTNIYVWNNYDESALVAAMKSGNKRIVRVLLERDADLASKSMVKPVGKDQKKWVLKTAVDYDDNNILREVLKERVHGEGQVVSAQSLKDRLQMLSIPDESVRSRSKSRSRSPQKSRPLLRNNISNRLSSAAESHVKVIDLPDLIHDFVADNVYNIIATGVESGIANRQEHESTDLTD